MNGHIVSKLCQGKKREALEDELLRSFHTFNAFFFCVLPFYYLSKEFKAHLESFWSQYWQTPPLRQVTGYEQFFFGSFSVCHFKIPPPPTPILEGREEGLYTILQVLHSNMFKIDQSQIFFLNKKQSPI